MSLTNLKKSLAHKTNEELIQEIALLYKKFAVVKEYYEAQQGDASVVLEKYQKIIDKEFSGHSGKARLSVARKAVNDFKKLSEDPVLLAQLMFTFIEAVSGFCNEYGVDEESYYTSAENMFYDLLKHLHKHGLLKAFEDRAYLVVKRACDGWGHQDSLNEYFTDAFGQSAV